jgi:hypothetical protein
MDEKLIGYLLIQQCIPGCGWRSLIKIPVAATENYDPAKKDKTIEDLRDYYVEKFMDCQKFWLSTKNEAVIINVENGPLRFEIMAV